MAAEPGFCDVGPGAGGWEVTTDVVFCFSGYDARIASDDAGVSARYDRRKTSFRGLGLRVFFAVAGG